MSEETMSDSIIFKTSSFCSLGDCVEVGEHPDGSVELRDTKNRVAGSLTCPPEGWAGVIADIKAGKIDYMT